MVGYVVNVATKPLKREDFPRHIFRTADDSIATEQAARQVAADLRHVYPFDNYSISITLWRHVGIEVEADYGGSEE